MSVSLKPFYKLVDGFPLPPPFPEDNIRSVINYKPRKDDVFIVTYPKCGTTWAQHIILLIFRAGRPLDSADDLNVFSPFIDREGAIRAEEMPRPGVLKTHLPYHLAPISAEAKYIYVTRNPKDCCVSYFHHSNRGKRNYFNGNFDQYFELFITGEVEYGDYFDHLLGWYTHRNDPNVLFLTYEEFKEDIESSIWKMAIFLDDEKYAEPIRNNPEIMNNIKKFSSFDYVKESINKAKEVTLSSENSNSITAHDLKLYQEPSSSSNDSVRRKGHPDHLRKGIVGDWKNYFSDEQSRRLKEKFAEKAAGTDLTTLWPKYM